MLDHRWWEGELRTRTHQYEIHVQECRYFDFLWPNTCLDEPLELGGRATSLREQLGLLNPRLADLETLSAVTPKLGAGVVVLTSDDCAVVAKRGKSLAIAAGGYHLSVAEGASIEDMDEGKPPAPFAIAERGLLKELNLVAGQDYQRSDLRCLGTVLDTERIQPMFFFILRTHLTFDQVAQRWARAEDRSENPNLIRVPWSPPNAYRLVRGEIELEDSRTGVVEHRGAASNHARAGYALTALHVFGPPACEPW
jgi:hypothetical protein